MPLSTRPTLPSIHSLDLPFMPRSSSSPFSTSRRSSSLSSSEEEEEWSSRSPSPASSLSSISSSASSSFSEPSFAGPPFSRPGPSCYEAPPLRAYPSSASLRSVSSTSSASASSTRNTKLRLVPCALADLDAVILVPSPPLSPSSLSPNPAEGKGGKPLMLTGAAAQAFKHPSALKALGKSARVHPYRIVGGQSVRRASVASAVSLGGCGRGGSGYGEGRGGGGGV